MNSFNHVIPTDRGRIDAYLSTQEPTPRPGLVLLPEIFGVNRAMRLAADQFALEGFVVMAVDLFCQVEPRLELGYSEEERERAIALWQRMDDGVALADTRAAVDALAGDPRCDGRVSVIGFCLGGKYALQCAAAGGIDASVSFYPVRVQDYQQQLLGLKCPTQVHVGDADPHIPPEVAQLLSDALSASPAHELHVYPGAGHGFFNPVRSFGYAPEAAAVALARSTRFLKHQRAA